MNHCKESNRPKQTKKISRNMATRNKSKKEQGQISFKSSIINHHTQITNEITH